MNKCPNCGEETISNFSKFMLGPGRTIECKNCHEEISVSWWTMVLLLVVLMVMFSIDDRISMASYTVISLGLIVAYLLIHKYFIKLVVKKD